MFGYPRLLSLVTDHSAGAEGLTAYVMEALARFAGKGTEQEDDITLVALERSRSGPQLEP